MTGAAYACRYGGTRTRPGRRGRRRAQRRSTTAASSTIDPPSRGKKPSRAPWPARTGPVRSPGHRDAPTPDWALQRIWAGTVFCWLYTQIKNPEKYTIFREIGPSYMYRPDCPSVLRGCGIRGCAGLVGSCRIQQLMSSLILDDTNFIQACAIDQLIVMTAD